MKINFFDSFTSFLAGLGIPGRSKPASMTPSLTMLTQLDVENLYRGDWVSRKIIEIPANDSTRAWRNWQAEDDEIEEIEAVEQAFNIQRKLNEALVKARLYGGACLVLGIDGTGDFNTELDLEKVAKDSLKFVHVVGRWRIAAGETVRDITSPWYGEPSYYLRTTNPSTPPQGGVTPPESTMRASDQLYIHPSRVIRLLGLDYPDLESAQDGWSDSVLQPVYDAVRDANLVGSSIAHLISEAKFDVIKIPNLTDIMSTDAGATKLSNRFTNANTAKSVVNSILIDSTEEWQRIQTTFTGMPEVMQMYLAIASGAADIPATRLLGKSPDGMNATGDSDLRNYYDRVSSDQNTRLKPALQRLDEVLLRHVFGDRPEDIYYDWNPLWQIDEVQKADIGLKKAQTFKIDADLGLIKPEALAKVRVNQLTEDGTYPGIEAAVEEFGEFDQDEEDRKALEQQEEQLKLQQRFSPKEPGFVKDSTPAPLYVFRPLLNVAEFRRWALAQGFKSIVDDPHVTLVYSRAPVDWMKMGQPFNAEIKVDKGGPRFVEPLGDEGAVVLQFACGDLKWRHDDMVRNGASHDYDEYQPHVTITYDGSDVDLDEVEPYQGKLVFGPETFRKIERKVLANATS